MAIIHAERGKKRNPRKTSKKGLTSGKRSARIAGLSRRRSEVRQGRKKLKKLLETLLTNGSLCDKIYKLSRKRKRARAADGSLKIEQQRCTKDSENSFEFNDALSN